MNFTCYLLAWAELTHDGLVITRASLHSENPGTITRTSRTEVPLQLMEYTSKEGYHEAREQILRSIRAHLTLEQSSAQAHIYKMVLEDEKKHSL